MAKTPLAPILLRRFRAADTQATRQVFYDSVHGGTARYYTPAQQTAWAGSRLAPPGWQRRLSAQETLVATSEGRVIGFMSMTKSGYLDLAFVLPIFMGTGVAAKLYRKLEAWAKDHGLKELTTEASHLARPFFLRQGWQVVTAQIVERHGHRLENFRMEKKL